MRTVYIQKDARGVEFDLPACYAAARGFNLLCDDVLTFRELEELPSDPDVIVFGGVLTVRNALRRLSIQPPPSLDYPHELAAFYGRKLERSTLGAIRRAEGFPDFKPVFIKPVEHTKAFTGHVVKSFQSLIQTAHIPDDYEVWMAPAVSFISEYRCFILRGKVVGLRGYYGDPLVLPNSCTIREAVAAWSTAPVACSIDFGVTDAGDTCVVEVNDGFALGDYGLNAITFARMIEARWDEMTGGKRE